MILRVHARTQTDRPIPTGSRKAARLRQRGQVLVIFAGGIIFFVGLMGLVIDVSWYWANSLRVQRTADAAALAGSPYLPADSARAYLYARNEAIKNGYTNGTGSVLVTPIQDSLAVNGGDPRQLDVTVSAPVPTFFMRIFGINTITASRSAKGIYVQPVPMGSPLAYYGVGCSVRKTGAMPACSQPGNSNGPSGIPNAAGGGQLNSQGFFGAIITRGGNQQNGDAYAPANNGGSPYSGANAKYDPAGYNYFVVVTGPSGAVKIFDPGFCAMGSPPSPLNGANPNGASYGSGDHWIAGDTNPVSTYYTLWDTKGTNFTTVDDTQVASSGTTFENQTASDTANGGPANSTGSASMTGCDAYHNAWHTLASNLTPPSYPWTYRLQVQTSKTSPPFGTADTSINASTNAENMFSLEVTGGGSPQVYGSGRMAAYNNLLGGIQKFYLAQVDKTAAGKTLEIDLFDPGDVGGNATLKVLSPYNNAQSYATFSYTTDANCIDGNSDACSSASTDHITTAVNGSSSFNNTWIKILLKVQTDYGTAALWQGGWWQIEYNVGSGNDTTTWQVNILGNPVHLVVP
jgi:hypothetical protein